MKWVLILSLAAPDGDVTRIEGGQFPVLEFCAVAGVAIAQGIASVMDEGFAVGWSCDPAGVAA